MSSVSVNSILVNFLRGLFTVFLFAAFVWFWGVYPKNDISLKNEHSLGGVHEDILSLRSNAIESDASLKANESAKQEFSVKERIETVLQDIPFTSQAPTGDWSQSMFQDGCEEASMLMVVRWFQSKTMPFSSDEVISSLKEVGVFEKKRFGYDVDLFPEDTAMTLREYFGLGDGPVAVRKNVSKEDLIGYLYDKAVIIVPTNGKALHNPNFTAGGPDRHMLVLIGYDPKAKEFITNDPGTRRGEKYRYDEDVLYGAIRSYPTGNHQSIDGVKKDVVVIKKQI